MQRTATAAAPGKDFTTWDLPRLFAEIDRHFQSALAGGADCSRACRWAPGTTCSQKGTMPDATGPRSTISWRYEALDFYTSGEQAGAKPEDAFDLSADSPILGAAEEFMAWEAGRRRTRTRRVRRSTGHRALPGTAAVSRRTTRPEPAFADADLERLTWAWNTAFGEEKDARYQAALEVHRP